MDIVSASQLFKYFFAHVRERPMADVVSQGCQSNSIWSHADTANKIDSISNSPGNVTCPNAVLEPRVSSARIDEVSHGKLLHSPKSLKCTAIDHRPLGGFQLNEAMNRISDLSERHEYEHLFDIRGMV